MKKCIIFIIMGLFMVGCSGYKMVKLPKDQTVSVKLGEKRTLDMVFEEIMENSIRVNKDVYAIMLGENPYTWEMWVVLENGVDYHAIVFEDGKLIRISPVKDLEEARSKYKPHGTWKR